ncbi:UPF0280 family protein [Desulfitobacterium sp. Sab5]|uniref:UPF0280 family protein n=1 Tax=Desulfitobacterium nosdiversum TaxID=3375356 RepID=UPI003CE74A07
MITVLSDERVFLNYGPMQMMLVASTKTQKLTRELQGAAHYAITILEDLSKVLAKAKNIKTVNDPHITEYPLPLRLMVESVQATGDNTLTPMAAVAGTFSDLVADWLVAKGATKVMINNGGDIAVRLLGDEETKVGLTPSIDAPSFTHILPLSAKDGIGGIATSGLGGRSFTKGIASAVTVLATTARIADSCATLIANHCYADDPGITRVPAEILDPNTDIPGHLVITKAQNLKAETKRLALSNALAKAEELKTRGVIRGAVIFVDDLVAMIPKNLCYPVNNRR